MRRALLPVQLRGRDVRSGATASHRWRDNSVIRDSQVTRVVVLIALMPAGLTFSSSLSTCRSIFPCPNEKISRLTPERATDRVESRIAHLFSFLRIETGDCGLSNI